MKEHYNEQAQPNIALYGAEADLYRLLIPEAAKKVVAQTATATASAAQQRPKTTT